MLGRVFQRKLDRATIGPGSSGRTLARGQQIAARGTCYPSATAVSGLAAGRTYRGVFEIVKAGSRLFIPFANERFAGSTAHTTAVWHTASVQLNSGDLVQVTHLGATEWQVDPGEIVWVMLPPEVQDVVAGDVVYVRTFARTAIDGQNVAPAFVGASTYNIGAWYAEGDQTMNASPTTVGTAVSYAGPMGIFAQSVDVSVPCVAILSDSIGIGQGDTATTGHQWRDTTNIGPGWAKRACYALDTDHMQLSVQSGKASHIATSGLGTTRLQMLRGSTHCILALGSNDIYASDSAATVITNLITLMGWIRERGVGKIALATVTPRVSSGGDYTTLVGQAISDAGKDAQRLILNAAIRDSTNGLTHDDVLDIAVAAESDVEPGKWIPSSYTADGSHPTEAGYVAIAASVATDFATFMAS